MSDFTAGVRAAAERLAEVPDEVYPTDIFKLPTTEDFAEINALLQRERGHQLDGVAAYCMRHAYATAAQMLSRLAREMEEDA